MTMKEEFEKVKSRIHEMECKHEHKQIERDEKKIDEENVKAAKHREKIMELQGEEDNFIHRVEERLEEAEIHHDKRVVNRRENDIIKQEEKEVKHCGCGCKEKVEKKRSEDLRSPQEVQADIAIEEEIVDLGE